VALATCFDAMQNANETDVDCGGGACMACGVGQRCLAHADCAGRVCASGVCANTPTCSDQMRNGDESDADCGGSVCSRCGVGRTCGSAADCFSGTCTAGRCAAMAGCTDSLQNGDESDVDCGGSLCARCQGGQTCNGNGDCVSANCTNGTCVALANCTDGQKNGFESDVDCGGPFCAGCAVGKRCFGGSDCSSTRCDDHFLQSDPTWKFAMNQTSNAWQLPGYDDSAWTPVVSEGVYASPGLPWGGSPPMPPNSIAHWIWTYDSRNSSDNQVVFFRKTFVAPAPGLRFQISADDAFTAWVNGAVVTTGSLWFTPGVGTLSLPAGTQAVLAIRAQNNGGPGGLLLDVRTLEPACVP
jgi:hypothetical protein